MKPHNTKKTKGLFIILVTVSLLIITINASYAAKPDASNPFDSVWAAIDAIRADIASLKTNISSIRADAAANKSDIASVKADIESLEARVEAIAPAA